MDIFLTIDVESYTGDYNREVEGGALGLQYVLEQCRRYGIRATFFMEALGATRWGPAPLRDLCRRVAEAGHDLQLHVHPVTARLDGFQDRFDTMWRQDLATQTRLIRVGLELLHAAGVADVVAFRAGSLAANADTLAAMTANGLELGSNRDLDAKSSIESQLNAHFPVINDLSRCGAVLDLPVTALRSPLPALDGPYRHLEICAIGALEMRNALRRMARAGYACATILTHPAELFHRVGQDFVPDRLNCGRLDSLLRLMADGEAGRPRLVRECLTEVAVPRQSPPLLLLNPLWAVVRAGAQASKRLRRRRWAR